MDTSTSTCVHTYMIYTYPYVCICFLVLLHVHTHIHTTWTHVDVYAFQQEGTSHCCSLVKPSKNEETSTLPQSIGTSMVKSCGNKAVRRSLEVIAFEITTYRYHDMYTYVYSYTYNLTILRNIHLHLT